MAIARSRHWPEVNLDALRTFFHHRRDQIHQAQKCRQVFTDTYHELASLTDRDLADLGIARSNIHKLAWDAAYGE